MTCPIFSRFLFNGKNFSLYTKHDVDGKEYTFINNSGKGYIANARDLFGLKPRFLSTAMGSGLVETYTVKNHRLIFDSFVFHDDSRSAPEMLTLPDGRVVKANCHENRRKSVVLKPGEKNWQEVEERTSFYEYYDLDIFSPFSGSIEIIDYNSSGGNGFWDYDYERYVLTFTEGILDKAEAKFFYAMSPMEFYGIKGRLNRIPRPEWGSEIFDEFYGKLTADERKCVDAVIKGDADEIQRLKNERLATINDTTSDETF